jgi:3-oxoacyl-[acyl-carrier protein] reductase
MNRQTIIVTGASQGIGRATALKMAKEGINLAITYAGNSEKAGSVVAELKARGANALSVRLDLKDMSSVRDLFPQVENAFGKVDVLISNAFGAALFKPLALVEEQEYDSLQASVKGTFFLLQEAANRLRDNGSIVVVSSGATSMPGAAAGLYAGSKSAIEQYAMSLAKELGDRQINVNIISPGVTQTEGLVAPQELVDYLIQQTPFKRLGQPDDVANAIVLLTSEEGRWINMQKVGANGGIL